MFIQLIKIFDFFSSETVKKGLGLPFLNFNYYFTVMYLSLAYPDFSDFLDCTLY